jgi:hypothetical protein
MERHRVTEEEVSRVADRTMSDIRELAGGEAPKFADVGEAAVGHLVDRLLEHYRAGLGPTKDELTAALTKIKRRTHDDLTHRPVQPAPAPDFLVGGDLNIINPSGPVAVARGDVHQHVEGFDFGALLEVLAELRRTVEASQMSTDQRRNLTDDISAIEAVAKQPKPDAGLVKRMGARLWKTLEAAGVPILVSVGTAELKRVLGFPSGA